MAKQPQIKVIDELQLTELEFITLYEAFQLAPYNRLLFISINKNAFINTDESLSRLAQKMDIFYNKILQR